MSMDEYWQTMCISQLSLPQQKPLTGGVDTTAIHFLAVLEARKAKIQVLADLVSGESLFIAAPFSQCPHMAERMGEFSGVF